jgi:hypothetical protein
LYNAPAALERSAEVYDDDPALGIVLLVYVAVGLGRGTVSVHGQLHPGLFPVDTSTLFFFSPPNLVDDEGRKHRAASLSR